MAVCSGRFLSRDSVTHEFGDRRSVSQEGRGLGEFVIAVQW